MFKFDRKDCWTAGLRKISKTSPADFCVFEGRLPTNYSNVQESDTGSWTHSGKYLQSNCFGFSQGLWSWLSWSPDFFQNVFESSPEGQVWAQKKSGLASTVPSFIQKPQEFVTEDHWTWYNGHIIEKSTTLGLIVNYFLIFCGTFPRKTAELAPEDL